MPPINLVVTDFEGESGVVNLKVHDPNWQYDGDDDRYRVHPAGYADAKSGAQKSVSMARYTYTVASGIKARVYADVFREGVDQVGGGLELFAFGPSGPIPDWSGIGSLSGRDCLLGTVQRHSFGTVAFHCVRRTPIGTPGPVSILVVSIGELIHLGGTGRRYIMEWDEVNKVVNLYRADFLTGENEEFLGVGVLPQELIDHAPSERLTAWRTQRVASGLVNFRCYEFGIQQIELPPPPGPECTLRLTVFGDDNITPLWEVATDPAHAFPYLEEPDGYGEHEIDLARGTASTGEVRVKIIDKAIIAGDQDGGFMASKLYELGIPAIGGRRCRLIRFVSGSALGYQVIVDGPAGQPIMEEGYAGFSFEIRDWHEKLRKVRMFDVLTIDAPALVGAAPAGSDVPGTEGGITWGSLYH